MAFPPRNVLIAPALVATGIAVLLLYNSYNESRQANHQIAKESKPTRTQISADSGQFKTVDEVADASESTYEPLIATNKYEPTVSELFLLRIEELIEKDEKLEELPGILFGEISEHSLEELQELLVAVEALKYSNPDHYFFALTAIHEAIYRLEPAVALQSLLSYDEPRFRSALSGYYNGWAQKNPQLAYEHLQANIAHGNTHNHDDAFLGIAIGAISSDRLDLIPLSLDTITDADTKRLYYDTMFYTLFEKQEIGVLEDFVSSLQGEDERLMGELRLQEVYGKEKPEQALLAISAEYYPEHQQTIARNRIFTDWTKKSPSSAAQWLETQAFPEKDLSSMLLILIREWSQQSQPEVLAWIEEFEDDPVFDRALDSLNRRLSSQDPS